MTTLELMRVLQGAPISAAIADSAWLFPFLETVHVLALCIVVGSIGMMDLRLLGMGSTARTVTELTRRMLPWTWSAFVVAGTCGALMFVSKASAYYLNLPFRLKMLALLLAGANMAVFHLFVERDVQRWNSGPTPVAAKVAGGISLALWISIVAAGRWIGFTM